MPPPPSHPSQGYLSHHELAFFQIVGILLTPVLWGLIVLNGDSPQYSNHGGTHIFPALRN